MWEIDWPEARNWMGAIGGLTGLLSFAWTRWDAYRLKAEKERGRLSVDPSRRADGAMQLCIRYTPRNPHEGASATLTLLEPDLAVLHLEKHLVLGSYAEFVGFKAGSGTRQITLPLPLGKDGVTQNACYLAGAQITRGPSKMRVLVRSSATKRVLIDKTIPITPIE